jgi:hypothetical protein
MHVAVAAGFVISGAVSAYGGGPGADPVLPATAFLAAFSSIALLAHSQHGGPGVVRRAVPARVVAGALLGSSAVLLGASAAAYPAPLETAGYLAALMAGAAMLAYHEPAGAFGTRDVLRTHYADADGGGGPAHG